MSEQPHVVVTRTTEPGKVPQVRVYGPYPSRRVARREARTKVAGERLMASLGRFSATAHRLIDNRPQWEALEATVHVIATQVETGALADIEYTKENLAWSAEEADHDNRIIPGSPTVPPGSRTWDAHSIGVYSEGGHWLTSVTFKTKRQARRFHKALNSSLTHNGTKEI